MSSEHTAADHPEPEQSEPESDDVLALLGHDGAALPTTLELEAW